MSQRHDLNDEIGKQPIGWGDESDESGGGIQGAGGGSSGKIEFSYQDSLSVGPRDDQRSPQETKRLLVVHEDRHKDLVVKAKELIADRKVRRAGQQQSIAAQNRAVLNGGPGQAAARFDNHPILSKKMSGMRDESPVPRDYENKTNEELADKLENRLQNRLQNQLTNRPSNTPTLRRS